MPSISYFAEKISFGKPGGSMVSAFEKMLGGDEPLDFAAAQDRRLRGARSARIFRSVKEKMELTICVSPEAGWSELESFLGDTKSTLTVAMYQFTAPHIFEAVDNAVTPAGRKFELILHPVPEKPAKTGVKANDLDEEEEVIEPLEKEMKKRFELTWATLVSRRANPDGLFASAYHIKVAVRDGNAVLALQRQLAIVEPAERASVRRPSGQAAGRIPEQIQPRLSRHHREREARRRSTSSTSSATSSSPPAQAGKPCSFAAARSVRARGGGRRSRSTSRPAAIFRAAAAEPRGERPAAAHAGQLRGACAEADQVGEEERLVPEPVHQLPRHRATTSPNSGCWSARSRTRSTRSSTSASSAAT